MWWGLHMWATIVDWSCRNRQKTTFLVIFSHFPHSIDKSHWNLSVLWGKWEKMSKKVVFWRFRQLQSTMVARMCSPHHIWYWKLGKGYLKSFLSHAGSWNNHLQMKKKPSKHVFWTFFKILVNTWVDGKRPEPRAIAKSRKQDRYLDFKLKSTPSKRTVGPQIWNREPHLL